MLSLMAAMDPPMKPAHLAKRLGRSRPSVNAALGTATERAKTSALVPEINEVVGLPAPTKSDPLGAKTPGDEKLWLDAGERAAALGAHEALLEWVELGERFVLLKKLGQADAVARSLLNTYERSLEESSDEIYKPHAHIPIVTEETSDRSAKTVHGAKRNVRR